MIDSKNFQLLYRTKTEMQESLLALSNAYQTQVATKLDPELEKMLRNNVIINLELTQIAKSYADQEAVRNIE